MDEKRLAKTAWDKPTARPVRRVLNLWLRNWPIQRRVVARAELKRQSVILVRTDPHRGQWVAAASPRALREGVVVGMPVSEARSLLRRCHRSPAGSADFHVLPHEPDQDLAALRRLALALDAFSPVVGLEPTDPPEGLMLEVAGLGPLFLRGCSSAAGCALDESGVPRGERELARALLEQLRELGFHARVAIADTPGMAWAAVRHLATSDPEQPVLVPVGDRRAAAGLPVAALRLPDDCLDTLYQLGISRIDRLQSLPRADVAVRLGEIVPRRLDQLFGAAAEPIEAVRRPDEFRAKQFLEYPISDQDSLQVVLEQLVRQVCADLSTSGQGALEWSVQLYRAQHRQPLQFCVRLFQPTDCADQVLALLQMQMEQAWQRSDRRRPGPMRTGTRPRPDRPGPVRENSNLANSRRGDDGRPGEEQGRAKRSGRLRTVRLSDGGRLEVVEVSVSVTACVVMAESQRELFDENPRQDDRELAHLVNRLACRLGRVHVTTPVVRRGAQPEQAFRFVPLLDRPRRRSSSGDALAGMPVLARPLQLFSPPLWLQPEPPTSEPPLPGEVGRDRASGDSSVRPVRKSDAGGSHPVDPFADWNREDHPPALLRRVRRSDDRSGANRSASRGALVPDVMRIVRDWGPERIETGWWRGPTTRRDYWRVETETHQQFWVFRDLRTGRWYLHGTF